MSMSSVFSDIIGSSNGRIITVTFKKKNGDERTMNCRLGVKKHLRGGVSTLPADKYIIVYDMQKREYRAINRNTINRVSINGETAIIL